jgi:uncharacterized protein YkwD
MKFLNAKTTKTLVALTSLAVLTACGGGSGGSSPAASTGTGASTTPVVVSPTADTSIVTSVPSADYASGSEESAAFTLLNAERGHCGFGLLKENAKLNISAQGHADWLLINGDSVIGHYQVTGTPSFTGVTPQDRETAAGYGNGDFEASEVTAKIGATTKVGQGVSRVRDLLIRPYHEIAMMRGYRDVGVSIQESNDVGLTPNNRVAANIDFGVTNAAGKQAAPANTLRTYPCDGSTGINRSMNGETPSPVPSRNLAATPLGSTIAVIGDVGTTLAIASASMTNASTGADVPLRTPVTNKNDPYTTTYLLNNEGYVSADNSLDPSTTYSVTITGMNNSSAFTKTFSFTTGQN